MLRQALETSKAVFGEDDIRVANTLHELGFCLWGAEIGRQLDEAEKVLRHALDIRKAKLGDDHIEVALTLHVLGVCIRDAGRHKEAEKVLRQALEIKKANLAEDDQQIAVTLHELGVCMREAGRLDEAEKALKHALEILEAKLGNDHLDFAFTLHVLGLCIRDAGRHSEGEEVLSQALQITRAKLGIVTKTELEIGNEEPMKSESPPSGFELVNQFNHHAATFVSENSDIRLKVDPGCLDEGQVAGPITVFSYKRYVAECDDQRLIVSVVVDCQPSGSIFNLPLDLDFRVGGPQGKQQEDEDSSDGETCVLNNEETEEYIIYLRDSYRVLLQESEGDVWKLLKDDEVTVLKEGDTFFLRASISHFSRFGFGKKESISSGVYVEKARWNVPPLKQEIEFVNETDRVLYFLAQPPTFSLSKTAKNAVGLTFNGVGAEVGGNMTTEKEQENYILESAIVPNITHVISNGNTGVDMAPSSLLRLLSCSGKEAVVVMMTVTDGPEDDETVHVWFSRIVKHRRRVTITNDIFRSGKPLLGKYSVAEHKSIAEAGMAALKRSKKRDSASVEEEKDAPSPEEGWASSIFGWLFVVVVAVAFLPMLSSSQMPWTSRG